MRIRELLASCVVSLVALSAAGDDKAIKMRLGCSATAQVGSTITMDLRLINGECDTAYDVRLMTAIAGNANETLGGVGVYGPVVASEVSVPAATDHLPGTCNTSTYQCDGSFNAWCFSNEDCDCVEKSSGIVDLELPAPPAVPAAHVGTVESHVIISEWDSGGDPETLIDQCLVEVLPAQP